MVQCQKNVNYPLNQPSCKNSQKDHPQKKHKKKGTVNDLPILTGLILMQLALI